jgi:diacylglycerol kinase (ATP)
VSSALPIYVVFNPSSGKGRGAALVEPVLRALARSDRKLEHGLTQKPGDEAALTDAALARGFRKIVAVGGDGTWSNVGNAIIRSGQPAALGLIAGGTGCDLAKSLGIPARDVVRAAQIIGEGEARLLDVGRVEGRYFLNVVGFGFDIAVIEDSRTIRYLGGDLLYLYCALRQLYRYRGFTVDAEVDGVSLGTIRMMMLVVSNARIFGGGFKIAPQASLSDGRLDYVAFRDMTLARRLPLMLRLLKGTHGEAAEVDIRQPRRCRLRFDAPPAYETDGEWNRAGSSLLDIECVPAALRILVPKE